MLCAMVTRRRLRAIVTALSLYVMAALLVGYFGVNAYNGNRGLRAKQDIDQQIAALTDELNSLRIERDPWEKNIKLPRAPTIDRDMLDQRARDQLGYATPDELILRVNGSPPAA